MPLGSTLALYCSGSCGPVALPALTYILPALKKTVAAPPTCASISIWKETQPVSLRKKGEWQKVLPRYPGRYTHSGCFIFFYKFSPHFKINLHNYIWQRGQRDNDSAPWLPLHPPPGQPGFRPDDHSPLLSLGEGSSAHQPLLLLTSASSDLTLHDPRDYSPPCSGKAPQACG